MGNTGQKFNPAPGLLNLPGSNQMNKFGNKQQQPFGIMPSLLGFPDADMFNKFTSAMQKMAQAQFNTAGGLLPPPDMANRGGGKTAEIAPPASMAPCKEPERFNEVPKKPVSTTKKQLSQQGPPRNPTQQGMLPVRGLQAQLQSLQAQIQSRGPTLGMAEEPGKNTVHFDLLTGKMIGQKPPPMTFQRGGKGGPPQGRFSKRAGLGMKSAMHEGHYGKGFKGQKQMNKMAMKMGKNKGQMSKAQMNKAMKQGQFNKGNTKMGQKMGQYNQSMAFQNPWAKKVRLFLLSPPLPYSFPFSLHQF